MIMIVTKTNDLCKREVLYCATIVMFISHLDALGKDVKLGMMAVAVHSVKLARFRQKAENAATVARIRSGAVVMVKSIAEKILVQV